MGHSLLDFFRNLQFEILNSGNIPQEFFQTLLIGQECIVSVDEPNLSGTSASTSTKWNCLICGTMPSLSTIQMVDHLESKDHYISYLATYHPKIYEKLKDMVRTNLNISRDGCIRLPTKDKKTLYETYLQQEYQKLGPNNLQNSAMYWRDKMPRKCVGHIDVVKEIMEQYKERLSNGYIPLENGILSTNPATYNFQSRLGDAMAQQMELVQMMQSYVAPSSGQEAPEEKYRNRITESSKLQATIIELLQHFLLGTPHAFMDKLEADKKIKDQHARSLSGLDVSATEKYSQNHVGKLGNGPSESQISGKSSKADPLDTVDDGMPIVSAPHSGNTTTKSSLLQRYLKSEVLKYMNKNKSSLPPAPEPQQTDSGVDGGPTLTQNSDTTSIEPEKSQTNAYGTSINPKTEPTVKAEPRAKRYRRDRRSSSSSTSSSSSSSGSYTSSSRSSSTSSSASKRTGRFRPPAGSGGRPSLGGPNNVGGPTPLMNWVDPTLSLGPNNPQAALLSMMVMNAAAASNMMIMNNGSNAAPNPGHRRPSYNSDSHYGGRGVGRSGRAHVQRGGGGSATTTDYRQSASHGPGGDGDPLRYVFSDERDAFVEVRDNEYCFMDQRFNLHYGTNGGSQNFQNYFCGGPTANAARSGIPSPLEGDKNYEMSYAKANNPSEVAASCAKKKPQYEEEKGDKYDPFAQQDVGNDTDED